MGFRHRRFRPADREDSGGGLHRTMTGVALLPAGTNGLKSVEDRRRVVRALAGLFAAVSFHPSFALQTPLSRPAGVQDWLRRFGAEVLGDTALLGRFGAIYLDDHPLERDRERLSRLLAGDVGGAVGISLLEGIARDWNEHDVVIVAGWVCARSEARICAVLHLMGEASA
jgi:hypothetical protein